MTVQLFPLLNVCTYLADKLDYGKRVGASIEITI